MPTPRCHRGDLPGVAHYYVISAEPGTAVDSLWSHAGATAARLALRELGDAGAFTLVFNGRATRRRPWPHVHVFLARTVAGRRWALGCYYLKHLTRWARRAWLSAARW